LSYDYSAAGCEKNLGINRFVGSLLIDINPRLDRLLVINYKREKEKVGSYVGLTLNTFIQGKLLIIY
jgi:hypothetical protein